MNIKNDFHLDRRIQRDLVISEELYISGLIDITQWLALDLEYFLKEENRFFGIMISYFKTIKDNYIIFNTGCTEEDCDIYGKIMYLFKPIILFEYRKLEQRRLSKADRLIVMIKRILDLLEPIAEDKCHIKTDCIKNINEVITKMYDRIKNNGKLLDLKYMTRTMKYYMEEGLVGKICVDEFGIQDEINKRANNSQPISENNIMMEETKGRELWIGN